CLLNAVLGRSTERGTTIFLTSYVLEIVERLCSHVAIIHKGRLVAQGSLEELRADISGEAGSKTTLEQVFLSIVGQDGTERPRLEDRKSTRLNSSHVAISYAVFCLKKKKQNT